MCSRGLRIRRGTEHVLPPKADDFGDSPVLPVLDPLNASGLIKAKKAGDFGRAAKLIDGGSVWVQCGRGAFHAPHYT